MNIIPILMYHSVGKPPPGIGFREFYVTPSQFFSQMFMLKIMGFRGVSMSEALPYLTGQKNGKIAVITFDDGYSDNLLSAAPILARFGFSATCYVVSGRIGQTNTWDSAAVNVVKPTMTIEQLKQWIGYGMEVGAHSRTHPHLTQCSSQVLASEISGSKEDLERILQTEIRHFCYPYGSWNAAIAKMVKNAGFLTACTTRRGRARSGDALFWLSRVKVRKYDWPGLYAWKVAGRYEDKRAYDLGSILTNTTSQR
jgi:peptidoglycan/xylan/chitin deacetylase (PgdA/CDA1 family)